MRPDILPAPRAAIADHDRELATIRDHPAPRNFENGPAAFERSAAMPGQARRRF